MVRVIIKGGVWKNTEDEVLKAAVMKYGKNQWSRIASLLHRKSAKQCKARWFEWLDPGIKKTEWSREEDEKLLHLAKLMPTQWRTIAPIVGRTPAQCLERYEQLLDQAQKKAEGDEEVDDPRKLKPGEIDPTPETKPARPDPIDMDEDELEMLSEARARLANTQGKKAKRKAREKQLSEARRLASLQKRRELRAAGIAWGRSKGFRKNKWMNEEIPFEKPVPVGFHDPSEDKFDKEETAFRATLQHKLDPQRRDEKEAQDRKKDREKLRKKREDDNPESIFSKSQPDKKRSKLVLPTPQISEQELDEIVKVGRASEVARETAENTGEEGGATNTLLSDYSFNTAAAQMRTPRTPATGTNIVQMEAQNLLALTNTETPLKGGENTPLTDSDFSGITPKRQMTQTPNTVLGTPSLRQGLDGTTPSRFTPGALTPGANGANTPTPFRDTLSINPEDAMEAMGDVHDNRQQLKRGLRGLPVPKNDYEIVVPGEEDNESMSDSQNTEGWVQDAADLSAHQARMQLKTREDDWLTQAQAVQRELPRPLEMNMSIVRPSKDHTSLSAHQKAEELIKQEMMIMLHNDVLNNPTQEQRGMQPGSSKSTLPQGQKVHSQEKHDKFLTQHPMQQFTQEQLQNAKELLEAEVDVVKEAMGHGQLPIDAYSQVWEECYAQILYLPEKGRYTRATLASRKERVEAMSHKLDTNRKHMVKEAKKAAKTEKKLKVLLGGYQSRSTSLIKQFEEFVDQTQLANVEEDTFASLRAHEDVAIPKRLASLTEEVGRQQERERELQTMFDALRIQQSKLALLQNRDAATVTAQPVVYNSAPK